MYVPWYHMGIKQSYIATYMYQHAVLNLVHVCVAWVFADEILQEVGGHEPTSVE